MILEVWEACYLSRIIVGKPFLQTLRMTVYYRRWRLGKRWRQRKGPAFIRYKYCDCTGNHIIYIIYWIFCSITFYLLSHNNTIPFTLKFLLIVPSPLPSSLMSLVSIPPYKTQQNPAILKLLMLDPGQKDSS